MGQHGAANPSWLNNKPARRGAVPLSSLSAGPGEGSRRSGFQARLDEDAVLLAEVAGGRGDDGTFPDDDFSTLPDGLANVVFAYELGRFFILRDRSHRRRRGCRPRGVDLCGDPLWRLRSRSAVAPGRQELIDPSGERFSRDPDLWWRFWRSRQVIEPSAGG